ncbi:putative metal-binding motif-containing protein [Polyangium sp. y55x31]|uniref:putative metal-binding motif-containing protein n=1 Tax=Polyangium sp. y55x31 TaxID=3042688 RepID=UPI002482910C|nr:putative metal-binding motif-containing protein [Polyangium sp. y55x31]MDI1478469.1 putative metal-binding motif-containing protein [Polyangium sp. y55x31]
MAAGLLGCETFIALGDDYTQQCTTLTTVYRDADKDGEGNLHDPLTWCGDLPPEYVTNTLDCNDKSADVNTRASDDQCDGIDQDCDGKTDEDFPVLDCPIPINETESCPGRTACVGKDVLCYALFYYDADKDGIGSTPRIVDEPGTCAPPSAPEGGVWVQEGNDCDDTNPAIHPGAEEICDDGVDQNCNGTVGKVYLRQTFSQSVLNAGAAEARWFSGTNSGFVQAAPGGGECNGPEDDVTGTEDGNVVGVGLGACVPPGTSGELESPVVDTMGAPKLWLHFQEWIDFSPAGSFGAPPTVTLSVQQGAQRTTLLSLVKPGPTDTQPVPGWTEVKRELDTLAGPATSLVWSYESGDTAGWGGYAIDDVLLVDEACSVAP